mmetsp:Transcript_57433/g.134610  ORF Transcript_57433/g.134610 Transcript_57433/m.134610 type:complete len:209 (-) Transcript_57433:70-696(-)
MPVAEELVWRSGLLSRAFVEPCTNTVEVFLCFYKKPLQSFQISQVSLHLFCSSFQNIITIGRLPCQATGLDTIGSQLQGQLLQIVTESSLNQRCLTNFAKQLKKLAWPATLCLTYHEVQQCARRAGRCCLALQCPHLRQNLDGEAIRSASRCSGVQVIAHVKGDAQQPWNPVRISQRMACVLDFCHGRMEYVKAFFEGVLKGPSLESY